MMQNGYDATIKFLYPSSMLQPKKVDEHFAQETALLKNDFILYSDVDEKVYVRGQDIQGMTIMYRGWILTQSQYAALTQKIEKLGAHMLVNPENYAKTQFINSWYEKFKDFTPVTDFYDYHTEASVFDENYANDNRSFVVKGQSKSLKNDWENSMFAKTGKDVSRIVENFKQQVSDIEEPVLVVRVFENWKKNELRVWFFNDQYLIQQHPNNTHDVDIDDDVFDFVDSLHILDFDSPFFNIDIVQSDHGLRVVETGNGQVSESSNFAELLNFFDLT